jgi:hypothetical protein
LILAAKERKEHKGKSLWVFGLTNWRDLQGKFNDLFDGGRTLFSFAFFVFSRGHSIRFSEAFTDSKLRRGPDFQESQVV